ncbi:hypothetical protein OAT18_04000, partial [Tenacibaculum sp.]|nr:hypothetical protein [Tenacibaculum sp.]
MKKITYSLFFKILVFILYSYTIQGQIKKNFTPRFSEGVKGNVTIIANNVVSQSEQGDYNLEGDNHDFNSVFVDIDLDNSTFNSSSANFSNPEPSISCLTIKKAYLYWAAADKEESDSSTEPDWDYNEVKFMLPGSSIYKKYIADEVIFRGRDETNHFSNDPYVCFKDITNDVLGLGNPYGKYQIANVRAKIGSLNSHNNINTGTSGGWQVVFIYESPVLPAKNISIFDGYAHVTRDENNFEIGFNGFQTVPTGTVKADVVIGALEGDRTLGGDKLQIKEVNGSWRDIYYGLRGASNFFNSRIAKGGNEYVDRNPASKNTLGFDADVFPLNNPNNEVIGNNQTSARIRLTSNQETYGLFLLGFSVDIWKPDLGPLFLTANPSILTPVNVGSSVTFGVDVKNNGNDDARSIELKAKIPTETELVLPIVNLPSGITYSYNSGNRELTFFVQDGIVNVGSPIFNISFETIVSSQCYFLETNCPTNFGIQLEATYNGVLNPVQQKTLSSSEVDVCGLGNNQPTKITVNKPNEAVWATVQNNLDRTVSCDDSDSLLSAQALNPSASCSLTINKIAGTFMPSVNCSLLGTYTNTWTFTDGCGRTSDVYTQTITVEDTTAPTGTAPDDITGLQCISEIPVADIESITTESDNCGGSVTVTVADTNNGASGCKGAAYIVTRTFTLTDCGGNSTDLVQTITVEDTTAPTGTAPDDITGLQCISEIPVADIESIRTESDNCGGSVTVTVADTNNGASGCKGSPYIVTRTFTLTDCGGNSTDLVQTITVENITPPTGGTPSGEAPNDITGLQCVSE